MASMDDRTAKVKDYDGDALIEVMTVLLRAEHRMVGDGMSQHDSLRVTGKVLGDALMNHAIAAMKLGLPADAVVENLTEFVAAKLGAAVSIYRAEAGRTPQLIH